MKHVGPFLLARLDAEIEAALRAIEEGGKAKAQVTVTFTLAMDEEAGLECSYALKGASAEKGDWQPSRQARLPMDEEGGIDAVTLSAGDRSVTLRRPEAAAVGAE